MSLGANPFALLSGDDTKAATGNASHANAAPAAAKKPTEKAHAATTVAGASAGGAAKKPAAATSSLAHPASTSSSHANASSQHASKSAAGHRDGQASRAPRAPQQGEHQTQRSHNGPREHQGGDRGPRTRNNDNHSNHAAADGQQQPREHRAPRYTNAGPRNVGMIPNEQHEPHYEEKMQRDRQQTAYPQRDRQTRNFIHRGGEKKDSVGRGNWGKVDVEQVEGLAGKEALETLQQTGEAAALPDAVAAAATAAADGNAADEDAQPASPTVQEPKMMSLEAYRKEMQKKSGNAGQQKQQAVRRVVDEQADAKKYGAREVRMGGRSQGVEEVFIQLTRSETATSPVRSHHDKQAHTSSTAAANNTTTTQQKSSRPQKIAFDTISYGAQQQQRENRRPFSGAERGERRSFPPRDGQAPREGGFRGGNRENGDAPRRGPNAPRSGKMREDRGNNNNSSISANTVNMASISLTDPDSFPMLSSTRVH